ncbi:MAG: right-handed parallel beta-helix repeat-containing protein, partial [Alphaproteobacteria bacterium]|nr:right-handed parallel beta-helix repeat-containing protein [Alphaproteobacteria bacterium]
VRTKVDDDATVFQDNTITISGNSVFNQDDDGIAVVNDLDDGATLRQTLRVDNNTVASNGGDGIFIDADVEGNSDTRMYQTATVRHNTAVNNGRVGLYIDLNVYDGAFSTQTFDFGHNSIADSGGAGVLIDIENNDGLTTTSFFLDFYNNVIHDNASDGFDVNHLVFGSAASGVFNAVVTGNSIVNNGETGIEVSFLTDNGGVSIVDVDFVGNTIGGDGNGFGFGDGIYVRTWALDDSRSMATLEFTDNTVFLNDDDGIRLRNGWDSADTGGMAVMGATFGGNDINANGDVGVLLLNDGDTADLQAFQTVLFTPGGNYIANNPGFGVYARNFDNAIQFVNLFGITFAGNGTAYDSNGGGATQTIVGP